MVISPFILHQILLVLVTKTQLKGGIKIKKIYDTVQRPEIVKQYNNGMGGVDLLDQLIAYYRIFMRSNKWPLRLIFHFVDFAVVQSWLEYKNTCAQLDVSKREILDLINFRTRLAKSLVYASKSAPNKRGRPVSLNRQTESPPPQAKKSKCEVRPLNEIRLDHIDHLPLHDNKNESGRCKVKNCNGKSHIICQKCRVHLRLNKNSNCFLKYHSSN